MDTSSENKSAKADQLNLQAQQRYIKVQAHIKVYGRRNAEMEQVARNGIEFIEAALELCPDNPKYLNTKALLLADGLGQKELGLNLLERAAKLDPDDIQIRQNIRSLNTPTQGCLVLVLASALGISLGITVTRLIFT